MINNKKIYVILVLILTTFFISGEIWGEKNAMPPAKVVVSEVVIDMIAPVAEFTGTVFFVEVSDVASEVEGKAEKVNFEEGERVKKDHTLVRLNSDLIRKTLKAGEATYKKVLSEIEIAAIELKRTKKLYDEGTVSEQIYDERRFRVEGLTNQAQSIKADIERFNVEIYKKAVKAPFDGVIIKRNVDRGEWLSTGKAVATIARNDVVDIVFDIPERILRNVKVGTNVKIRVAGREITEKIFSIIPKGDISTRTFPVKVRVQNNYSFFEGMEAVVELPAGEAKKSFVVPRDAVLKMFGKDSLFVIIDSEAKMIPVNVVGYRGMMVGVDANGLNDGMKVVIKGNERLRDGQAVEVIKSH